MRIILPGILLLYSAFTAIRSSYISGAARALFAVLGGLCGTFTEELSVFEVLMGTVPGLVMVIISLITRGALGMGDGLLICVTGLYLGFEMNIGVLLTALFMSAAFSAVLFLKKRNLKMEYPFVPFLFAAYVMLVL